MFNLLTRKSDPIKIVRADELFDDQKEIKIFSDNAERYFAEAMIAGIRLGLEQVGKRDVIDDIFDLPHARAILKFFKFTHAVNTLKGTKKDLQKLIDKALKEGKSNQQLAAAIAKKYGREYKGYRARRIARTEITGVVNAGTNEVYIAEGIKMKVWIVTFDGRQRTSHEQAHIDSHRSPVKIDGYFNVGGSRALYPGDPSLPVHERVNCRCTTISSDFLDIMQDGYVKLFLRQHGSLERNFARGLSRAFESQKKRVLKRIS